jgi:hypothetical protein
MFNKSFLSTTTVNGLSNKYSSCFFLWYKIILLTNKIKLLDQFFIYFMCSYNNLLRYKKS